MGAPITHWEIGAKDATAQQEFYSSLFDWKISADNPFNYGLVDTGGTGGVNGAVTAAPKGVPYLTIYAQVDNAQEYLDKAERLGGKALVAPMPIPGVGTVAFFGDPEGNVFGLFQSE